MAKSKIAEKAKSKSSLSTTIRSSTKSTSDNRVPPEGATILEKSSTVTTEKIENGYLVTKNFSGRYKEKDSHDSYGNYFNYDKKWYSEEDPLTVKVNNKELADLFDEE